MTSALPFDDFRDLLRSLPGPDAAARDRTCAIMAGGGGQAGALGRLEDIAAWLAAWSGRGPPAVNRPLVAIFAGNHGIVRRGVSSRRVGATAQAVERCAAGAAPVNQVCIAYDLGLKVFDLALHLATGDIAGEAALDERGCAATMAFGMEATAGGPDLLCLAGLGVGNETVAAALLAAVFGGSGKDWAVEDADQALTRRRVEAVDAALACHGSALRDPLEALRRVGGREFAAIAGAILAARMQKVPVVLDGLAATAAAAVLHAADPGALDHCLLAGLTGAAPHAKAAERLGLRPLLDIGVRRSEGVAGALAAGLVKASALVCTGLAEAGSRRI